MISRIIILFIVLSTYGFSTFSNEFYQKKYQGWFYFEEFLKQKNDKEKKEDNHDSPLFPSSNLSATERMENMQKILKEKKALAIIEPTSKNVLDYKRFERKILDQGEKFAHIGQRILLLDPSLDASIKNPTAQIARPIALKKIDQDRVRKIKMLSERFGLFFYFSSDCAYCHLFAPILKLFQEKYEWDIMPISIDGKGINEFPDFKTDNGSAQLNKIEYFPALMLFDAKTNQLRPFHYGFTTLDKLIEKIDLIDTGKEKIS